MFRLELRGYTNWSENDDNNDTDDITFTYTNDDQPTWDHLTDRFFQFLKAMGYCFELNEKLTVVEGGKDEDVNDDLSITDDNESPWKVDETPKRKGKKKK